MLKKNDLAKQFELVVQQEIKNYQDSLNQIHQTHRDLSDRIGLIKTFIDKNTSETHSKIGYLLTDVESLKTNIDILSQKIDKNLKDVKDIITAMNLLTDKYFANVWNKFKSYENLEQVADLVMKKLDSIQEMVIKNNSKSSEQFNCLNFKMDKELKNLKKEILETPTDASKVKEQLDSKINSHILDVQGVTRELRINSKNIHIIEKKLENIYTLIDRIQSKDSV